MCLSEISFNILKLILSGIGFDIVLVTNGYIIFFKKFLRLSDSFIELYGSIV